MVLSGEHLAEANTKTSGKDKMCPKKDKKINELINVHIFKSYRTIMRKM